MKRFVFPCMALGLLLLAPTIVLGAWFGIDDQDFDNVTVSVATFESGFRVNGNLIQSGYTSGSTTLSDSAAFTFYGKWRVDGATFSDARTVYVINPLTNNVEAILDYTASNISYYWAEISGTFTPDGPGDLGAVPGGTDPDDIFLMGTAFGFSQPYSSNTVFTEPIPEPIVATIDFDPDTLNKKSGGKWITAYIELEEGYSVTLIDGSTVLLNDSVPAYLGKEGWAKAEGNESNIMDHDGDGILERMVKFDRTAVKEILPVGDEVEVIITGKIQYDYGSDTVLFDFEGQDVIKVIDKGK